jgi:hypothetical protein
VPFTKTPTSDTYSQEDILLTREWTSRQGNPSGTKDEQFLNCFPEITKNTALKDNRSFIMKRAGSSTYYTPSVDANVRGMFYWNDNKSIIWCTSNDIYQYHTTTATLDTMSNVFSTTTGSVGFCTFLYDTGTVVVMATDGTSLVRITTTGTSTTCVDADLPANHIPQPVFLDGYLFLAKDSTGNIYNSDLNDPMSWSGDFLTAEMDGDRLVGLNKLSNYIVALGSETVEYFWDAANATGSPLARNATPIKISKVLSGVTQIGNSIYYIGSNSNSQLDVYKLQDFQLEPIGTPTVTRYLNSLSSSFAGFVGASISCLGHTFYVVNAGSYTFVYDLETKAWSRWAYQTSTEFNVTNAVTLQTYSTLGTIFTIGTSSVMYLLDDAVYQDGDTNFTMRVVTEPADFGTMNRKSMSKLVIVCDSPTSSSDATLYWTDDDYQTYSTGVNVDLSQYLPSVTRLGNFRERAFKLDYTANHPMRLQKFQVNINKGRN